MDEKTDTASKDRELVCVASGGSECAAGTTPRPTAAVWHGRRGSGSQRARH